MKPLKHAILRAQQGAVAIEAAIILPLMVMLMLGMVEMYQYFRVIAVVDRAAFTVANSMAVQDEFIVNQLGACDKDPRKLCTYEYIMPQIMQPLAYKQGTISFYNNQLADLSRSHQWVLQWQAQCSAASGACTAEQITNPQPTTLNLNGLQPLADEDDYLVVVTMQADYPPFALSGAFWSLLNKDITLVSTAYFRPRHNANITYIADETP